ncbi:MAG: Gfo/Idh/MocA family oxidoreductase, partial [Enterobacteriaceae bacterium]
IGLQGNVDTATVLLNFASGKQAIIVNSRRSGYGYDQRLELHGEKGLLRADNMPQDLVSFLGEESTLSARPMDFFLQRYAEAYRLEWQHFIDILAGKSASSVSGIDGEWALRLADAAQRACEEGGVVEP